MGKKGLSSLMTLLLLHWNVDCVVRYNAVQALVDRPNETRRVINFKRLALTDIKIDIPRIAKKKVLKEAYDSEGGIRHSVLFYPSSICFFCHTQMISYLPVLLSALETFIMLYKQSPAELTACFEQ